VSDPPWKNAPSPFEPPVIPPPDEAIPEVEAEPLPTARVNPDVETRERVDADGSVEILTTDLYWMLREAAKYCRESGDCVLSYDQSLQRRIGFCSVREPGKIWMMSLYYLNPSFAWMKAEAENLRQAGAAAEAERMERLLDIYRRYTKTSTGRARLAAAASCGNKAPALAPIDRVTPPPTSKPSSGKRVLE